MPLFECTQCGVADNTASAENFWHDYFRVGKPPLCSQCDPGQAKWHDEFPREATKIALERETRTDPGAAWILYREGEYHHMRARDAWAKLFAKPGNVV